MLRWPPPPQLGGDGRTGLAFSAPALGVSPRRSSAEPPSRLQRGAGSGGDQPASAASSPRPSLLRTAGRTPARASSPRRGARAACPAEVTFLAAGAEGGGDPRGSRVCEARRTSGRPGARRARCAADAWLRRRTAARTAGAQHPAGPWDPPALRPGPSRGRAKPVRCAPRRGRACSARPQRCSIGWAGARSQSIGLGPGGLPRSPGREGRRSPRVPSVPVCPNPPFGAPCFKLPLGRGRGRGGLRREGRGTGGDTAAPPGAGCRRAGGALRPARRGCGVVPGAWRAGAARGR